MTYQFSVRLFFVVYNQLLRIQHVVELSATPTYSTQAASKILDMGELVRAGVHLARICGSG